MLLTNYHTHCYYCDGKGSPQEMVDAAKSQGFKVLGFSSHSPIPVENDFCMQDSDLEIYIKVISELKQQQQDIEIYMGLEIEYVDGLVNPSDSKWNNLGLDFKIGSLHTLDAPDEQYPMLLSVDGPHDEFDILLNKVYHGDAKKMITTYYQRVIELCQQGGFDVLGHYDLVKKHNLSLNFFDEQASWYKEQALAALEAVAEAGVIMEVNYGGMLRGATKEAYPPLWLLKRAKALNIPVQINADAHAPDHLGVHHQDCRQLLLQAGYKEQRVLYQGKWQDISL